MVRRILLLFCKANFFIFVLFSLSFSMEVGEETDNFGQTPINLREESLSEQSSDCEDSSSFPFADIYQGDEYQGDEEKLAHEDKAGKQQALHKSKSIGQEEEGWRWRKHFTIMQENLNFDFDTIHQRMAIDESDISSQLCMKDNKPNIVLARFNFIIKKPNSEIKAIDVCLQTVEGKEIIFRSGRLAKDRSFFKSADILDRYAVYPPLESEEREAFHWVGHLNDLMMVKQFIQEDNNEQAGEKLTTLVNQTRDLINREEKNKHHLQEIEDALNERFPSPVDKNKTSEVAKSIIDEKVWNRIRHDVAKKSLQQKEQLFLHSEQSMLLFLKKSLHAILEHDFDKVRQEIIAPGDNLHDKKFGQILGIILHIHSRLDICNTCAPSLARECERDDSFVSELKKWVVDNLSKYIEKESPLLSQNIIGDILKASSTPFFAIFASVRQEMTTRDRRFRQGHDDQYAKSIDLYNLAPYFVVKTVDAFLIPGLENLKSIG